MNTWPDITMDEKEKANVQNMVAIDYGNGIVIPSETIHHIALGVIETIKKELPEEA